MLAVTFDLWHTLIQLSAVAEDRYIEQQEATLAEVVRASPPRRSPGGGPSFPPADAAHRAFSEAMARKGLGSPIADLVQRAATWSGHEPDASGWIRAIESLAGEQPFEAVPGAKEQLARLRSLGVRTAVVSNLVGETGRSMRRVMERLDLDRFIEAWAFSDELPWAKPAPEIFWHALKSLDTPPSRAVHVGDLGSDIHGARAAGYRWAVQFRGSQSYGARYAALCRTGDAIDPPPDRVLLSWTELPMLLDSLSRDAT